MVTVKKVVWHSSFLWKDMVDGSHVLKRTATMTLDIAHDDSDCTVVVRFCGESTDGRGFRCDGLSVPKIFRWFLPSAIPPALFLPLGSPWQCRQR